MSHPITPQDFSEIRWHGHRIWTEPPNLPRGPFGGTSGDGERPAARGLFRKCFERS
jgi:hypothetical protein